MKGGHSTGVLAIDYLVLANGAVSELSAPRHSGARRGTGCALASGIAAGLASGLALVEACARAKEHVTALWHAAA
jgi:hydroxymethylpyrimidine/phosphomethylpyrimidine kinase